MKWLNEKEHLGFKIESGFQDLISFVNLEIDFDQYFSRVISKSPNPKLTDISIVLQKLKTLKEINPDLYQLSNGHDFMKALSQYVRESGDGRTIGDEDISSIFRIAFTLNHFKKTELFSEIKSWAENIGCVLFA